ncbi:hypothetical protein PMAYCL1PPCAC_08356, partial [Pristionchus mayeri]
MWCRRVLKIELLIFLGITVMSVSEIVQSLLECCTITIHQIHDNVYALVPLGPIGWISQAKYNAASGEFATQTFIFLLWIPALCILQYLHLAIRKWTNNLRI